MWEYFIPTVGISFPTRRKKTIKVGVIVWIIQESVVYLQRSKNYN